MALKEKFTYKDVQNTFEGNVTLSNSCICVVRDKISLEMLWFVGLEISEKIKVFIALKFQWTFYSFGEM